MVELGGATLGSESCAIIDTGVRRSIAMLWNAHCSSSARFQWGWDGILSPSRVKNSCSTCSPLPLLQRSVNMPIQLSRCHAPLMLPCMPRKHVPACYCATSWNSFGSRSTGGLFPSELECLLMVFRVHRRHIGPCYVFMLACYAGLQTHAIPGTC